jgi:dTMP kinase
MFIAFEGFEGLGKSTLVRMLAQSLRERGAEVVESKEPGGTDIGNAIRAILLDPKSADMVALAEFLLFQASRAQLVQTVIRPALDRGAVVVLDRYTLSSVAYQVIGRGLPIAQCLNAIELATAGLVPDVTFLLSGSYETAMKRVGFRKAKHDRIEAEAEAFHRKVLVGYDSFARFLPWRIERIDAEPPVEEVFRDVVSRLEADGLERILQRVRAEHGDLS